MTCACGYNIDRFTRSGKPHKVCKACHNQSNKIVRQRLKHECFLRYGGQMCACCKATHFEFLTIDHINGDGAEHRRITTGGYGGLAFYLWLKRNKWPDGFQVLCFNCNCSKSMFGYCPHSTESRIEPESFTHNPRRYVRGESNYLTSFSDEQIRMVRDDLESGLPVKDVAIKHGMSKAHVYKIRRNQARVA